MKIHRGPSSTTEATFTDEKEALQIEREWEPGAVLYFDGTIDKNGTRHTDIGIEIEEADIVALTRAFLKTSAIERRQLCDGLASANREVEFQREALRKIYALSFKIAEAPSKEAFAYAVRSIINHYDPITRGDTKQPPELKWIEWTAI